MMGCFCLHMGKTTLVFFFFFFLFPSVKDFERGVPGKDFCFKISIA